MTFEISHDHLLGNRVNLLQPKQGYRVAMDTLFLAASLTPKPEECVLDVGAGVGAAMLCLAKRVPFCPIIGLEINSDLIPLGQQNIQANGFKERLTLLEGNLLAPPSCLKANSFHYVMTNPPYLKGSSPPSPYPNKALSHHESSATLQQWLDFCIKMLRPQGTLALIHRSDRLSEILTALLGKMGGVIVFPLWPKEGEPAKRLLIQARKQAKASLSLRYGMVLHKKEGAYTKEAMAVLQQGQSLRF